MMGRRKEDDRSGAYGGVRENATEAWAHDRVLARDNTRNARISRRRRGRLPAGGRSRDTKHHATLAGPDGLIPFDSAYRWTLMLRVRTHQPGFRHVPRQRPSRNARRRLKSTPCMPLLPSTSPPIRALISASNRRPGYMPRET